MKVARSNIHTIASVFGGSFLLAGCPEDEPGPVTETTIGEATTTGETTIGEATTTGETTTGVTTTGEMTTTGVTTTGEATAGETTTGEATAGETTGETTTGETTTGGAATGTTTGGTTTGGTTTGEATTTGEDTAGTTTGEATTTGETTGGPPVGGYGDCANDLPASACQTGEICLDAGFASACGLEACQDAGDCPAAASGTALVACMNLDGVGTDECYLDCSGGETCPDGMMCAFDFVCLWMLVPPGGGLCPDQELAMVPQTIMGDNTGLFDDLVSQCGAGGGEDVLYRFTAPVDGTFVFDTMGTAFDTVLSVLGTCGGPELDCNDDTTGLTSEVTVPLVAGQSVIIVVDSFDGEVGPFTLNVTAP